MKYSDLIDLISREVLDEDAWPTDPQEQASDKLNLCYMAVLAVGCDVPLHRLNSQESALQTVSYGSALRQAPLPDNVFTQREDLGIVHLEIEGEVKSIEEAIPISSLNKMGDNYFQAGNILFSVDLSGKRLYVKGPVAGDPNVKVRYVPVFEAATLTTDLPLTGKDVQRAAHIVAAHVSGTRIRDMAASQFNQLLNQTYRG